METIEFLRIVLAFLCILAIVPVIVFFARKNQPEVDVYKIKKMCDDKMEEDLETLNKGNKKIDEIEKKILICKKKLNMKLFEK